MDNSDFLSFDDFLADMGTERVLSWHDDALRDVRREIGFAFDLANSEDAQRFFTAVIATNQRATMLMLRDYHDWLYKQLDQRSLRLI